MENKISVVTDAYLQGENMSCSLAESTEVLELCDKIEALGRIVSGVDDTTAESYCVVTRS